ncbi:MAG: T9SS type A sorting domain-containing protein [Bacteroidota bacterium]
MILSIKRKASKSKLILGLVLLISFNGWSQPCGVTPDGDETSFGSAAWIGYVYDEANDFSTANYRGTINQTELFDEDFGASTGTFSTNSPCNVDLETFSVRFKMRQTFACGEYRITIGGDDGVRLSLDGGTSYVIDDYSTHPYRTVSVDVFLSGSTDMVLEFFENASDNRVSFTYSFLSGIGSGGLIGNSDQTVCTTSTPATLTNVSEAGFCSGALSYQWQESTDNINFTNIVGATSSSFDPTGLSAGLNYYRREASNGLGDVLYSNTASIELETPAGDETSFGTTTWIGYVYDGANNFSTNYLGEISETEIFDESFVTIPLSTSGCTLLEAQTFSVRFKLRKTFTCGLYSFTIGGDDGVRLSLDGGSTFFLDDFSDHAYQTTTGNVYLDGTSSTDMVLEYYENGASNRVTFSYAVVNPDGDPGDIGDSQTLCSATDPDAFVSNSPSQFCSGTPPAYQWQESSDNINFSDISGATGLTYDETSVATGVTRYYRRSATDGTSTLYSDTLIVTSATATGDQVTAGSGAWIAYWYEGANSFIDYRGFTNLTEIFDTDFGGGEVTSLLNGGCTVANTTYSIRARMSQTFACGNYTFTVGADDGYRLSLDGGATNHIDNFSNGAYRTTDFTTDLDGSYDLVIEYYENTGGNRLSFSYTQNSMLCPDPLPVELTYFTASNESSGVTLRWQTASELNNDFFEVQHSLTGTGESFQTIGQVDGNGTTNEVHDYTYTAKPSVNGYHFYRLKQVDYDGTFEYSDIVVVVKNNLSTHQLSVNMYPNPVCDSELTIDLNQPLNAPMALTIFNLNGKKVYESQFEPSTQSRKVLLPTTLPNGMYSVRIDLGLYHVRQKLMIKQE